jgi:hypothetical protein
MVNKNISDVGMHKKPVLAWRGSMEHLGVGKATPREDIWCTEWPSSMAIATTIQYQTAKRGWSFC